jgi:hypothetical protein
MLLGNDLLSSPEIKIGFHVLNCLKIEALKTILDSRPDLVETALEPYIQNDIGTLFCLRCATLGHDEFRCLYYDHNKPMLTFCNEVAVTARGMPVCQRHPSGTCPCYNIVKSVDIHSNVGIGFHADNFEKDKMEIGVQGVRPVQVTRVRWGSR